MSRLVKEKKDCVPVLIGPHKLGQNKNGQFVPIFKTIQKNHITISRGQHLERYSNNTFILSKIVIMKEISLLENKRKHFHQQVEKKILVLATIGGEWSTLAKCYCVTAIMLRYVLALLHNALSCGEKLLLLKVIALGIKTLSSLLIVIALVTFEPLLLL
jgi:hypothetical protein